MAVKIITPPAQYTCTCGQCGAVLGYGKIDVRWPDRAGSPSIDCPSCKWGVPLPDKIEDWKKDDQP